MKAITFLSMMALSVLANSQNVGIGLSNPEQPLSVKGGMVLDQTNLNVGTANNTLRFGSFSGEAIGSRRTAGTNQYGLDFYTQSALRMTITNSGNVGIGEISPIAPLNFASNLGNKISLWGNSTNMYGLGIQSGLLQVYTAAASDDIAFGYGNSNAFTENMRIKGNGNLGIGIAPSTGSSRVYISAPSGAEALSFFSVNNYAGGIRVTDTTLQILAAYGSSFCLPVPCTPPPPDNLILMPPPTGLTVAGNIGVGVNKPNAKLHINGSVLIGNASALPAPGYSLSVTGKMACEEIKVELATGWPDYVFEEDHKMLSLEELEQSILKNKHLPNLPSATEISLNKGFELGALNKKLLEKIEELTLYLIDANKKINNLQGQMNQLQSSTKK